MEEMNIYQDDVTASNEETSECGVPGVGAGCAGGGFACVGMGIGCIGGIGVGCGVLCP